MTASNRPATDVLACETMSAHLTALLDGELPGDETDAIRAHLAVCSACRRELDALHRLLHRAADAWRIDEQEAPVADLWSAVRRQIALADDGAALTDECHRTQARAEREGLPFIDLDRYPPEPPVLAAVPEHLARQHNALPVRKEGPNLWVAMADPHNIAAIDEIRVATRCAVRPMRAAPTQLGEALARAYPGNATPPSPATNTSAPAEQNETLALIVRELQVLRAEVKELRSEVARLHRERTATPMVRSSSVQLFPYARPEDAPRHIV